MGDNLAEVQEPESKAKTFLKEWLPYIIFFIAVILFRIFILINATIPTESMVNTIEKGNHIMGLKCSYWFADPQRGDIMVFHAPDTPDTLYIKRVIGTPGDTVEIKAGKTYINDVTPYADQFMSLLKQVIGEIFEPDVPFLPTQDRTRCTNCPFRLLCVVH